MKYSVDYRTTARQKLSGKWAVAIFVCIIYTLITCALSFIPKIGSVAVFVLSGPLTLGMTMFFVRLHRGEQVGVSTIFKGFNDFIGALAVYILTAIYTFLWSLLFIIPGIMKTYSYSMAFYLKSKKPELSGNEAISLSSEIMYGKRFQLFCLHLSFLGWAILSILTLGIGLLFLIPYMQSANTAFYEDAYNEYVGQPEVVELSENDVVVTSADVQNQPEQKTETREEQVSKIIKNSDITGLSDYNDGSSGDN